MVIIMCNYTRVGNLEVESISNIMIPGHPYLQSICLSHSLVGKSKARFATAD